MGKLDGYIENGNGRITVECDIFLNVPNSGKKTIVRKDNGETVEEIDMTSDELQVYMDFQKAE